MNTTENNKIIAEFLGSNYINEPFKDSDGGLQDFWHWTKPKCKIPHSIGIGELTTAWAIGNFHFHDDWNWLMEVWYKFIRLPFGYKGGEVTEQHKDYARLKDSISARILFSANDSPKEAYEELVKAIQWYNQQKQ